MQTESSSLRRSSRRAKKRMTYSVGDIVEIVGTKDGVDRVSSKGRLISKLTAESALKHRWLVGFDDTSFPDEDLYESDFGEILGKASTDSTPTPTSSTRIRKAASNSSGPSTRKSALKGKNNKTKESPSIDATVVTPETKHSPNHTASTSTKKTSKTVKNGKNNNNSKKQRVVNFDLPDSGSTTTADESSTAASERESKRAAAISAREARSKRRQAHFDMDAGVSQPPNKKAKTSNNSKKKSSTLTNSKDVVRIPMLTGTLVLYRGRHRRAEFIRKY